MTTKKRSKTQWVRDRLAIIDKYSEATGQKNVDLRDAASWAHRNGLMDLQPVDVIKRLAKELASASRQDYIEDENGEPVRLRHAVKIIEGEKQFTFWFLMKDATPEQMRLTAQARRRGALSDVMQIERDLRYYNKHFNPGDPIQMSFNYDPDVAEHFMPTEYPDTPPGGNDDEEDDPTSYPFPIA